MSILTYVFVWVFVMYMFVRMTIHICMVLVMYMFVRMTIHIFIGFRHVHVCTNDYPYYCGWVFVMHISVQIIPGLCLSSRCWGTCATQTCHNAGNWGTVGYLPPGSLLCPVCGGAQSEPGGWPNSRPLLDTPSLGPGAATFILGKKTGKFGPTTGGGGAPP